ncbi:ribonuclease R [Nitrosomonas stercoris]|uniref:Ribonuclease R n=1 Tax=Nitrosomonas stercoris TaxID=1444684 RepID=A0A4Y1YMY4_9PROT|nr:ribonuclease R [Nitrosomonas stercoris]
MSIKRKSSKKNKLRELDPFLEREQARYGTAAALPSREFILEVLDKQGVPISEAKLVELLGITSKESEFFHRRLAAMIRDGQIICNRKGDICVTDKLELVKGTVQGHSDGFGFLIPDDGSADLFLTPKEMHKVLHGDRIIVRVSGSTDRRGRRGCRVVRVLESANTQLVGRLYEEHGICFVVAEDKRINQDILVPKEHTLRAHAGQVVVVNIIRQPGPERYAQPIGHVVEILGDYAAPGMEIEIALRKFDLPYEFPEEVLAAKFPKKVLKKELAEREDIRHLPLVTIDSETAKDFDDAVYCCQEGKDFRLFVAIADVSHYVQHQDALDKEAFNRGNSVYFPRRVIPMLPEVLSNGLCSLNPQVDRLCMVCEMVWTAEGKLKEYRFYPAVMFSHARLTYTTVAKLLTQPKSKVAQELQEYMQLLPHVKLLHRLYKILYRARKKRGAIDVDTLETAMLFNNQGKIDKIYPVERNDAHRLIEECMLAANVCAADFLQKHQQPVLYRVHEGPTTEKLVALREFLKEFGLQLRGGDKPQAKNYARALDRIRKRPDAQLLQTVMLRSLSQALYNPDNIGHFGLAYDKYTHFTSPIRRYPDLLVHRAIKAALAGKQYEPGDWHEIGKHCSQTERRADEATREVESWLKCFYMQDKIGESFAGVITGVTAFGLFVTLDDIYVEGLVYISELPSDYFRHDPIKHILRGERSGISFRLGDNLRIKLVRVDLATRKIDFVLADNHTRRKRSSK